MKQEDIFDNYNSCFEGLEKLKDFQLDIPIDQNVKPVAQPMHRVPFSMRDKLEQKLNEVVDLDVIESRGSDTLDFTCSCCAQTKWRHPPLC